ncbi:MAG: M67 family metallopeptidase [Terriglobales bacterium]
MSLVILPAELERIREHGRRDYPNECCGFLLGRELNSRRVVTEARAAGNARTDSARNRFLITPEEYRESDGYARQRQLDVLGFYHSHPDHPARPSEFDRTHAWPWFSYAILAVRQGQPRELTSWQLSEQWQFEAEEIETGFRTLEDVAQHAR